MDKEIVKELIKNKKTVVIALDNYSNALIYNMGANVNLKMTLETTDDEDVINKAIEDFNKTIVELNNTVDNIPHLFS